MIGNKFVVFFVQGKKEKKTSPRGFHILSKLSQTKKFVGL
jgi:hypothetical protein